MAGLYDLLPEGLLSQLGGGLPQMNQAAAGLSQQPDQVQQQTPQQSPQQPEQPQGGFGFQGILNNAGIHTDGLMGRVGNALLAAGSEDPAAAILQLNKARKEQLEANKPKVTPLADGAFSMVTFPDGRSQIMKNADVANFLTDKQERTYEQALKKVILGGQVQGQVAGVKDDQKAASEAQPLLQQADEHLKAIQMAKETLPRMDWKDQVKGATGEMGTLAASLWSPESKQMNIDSQRRAAVRVMDWVKSSQPLKGALSNVEGAKLDMPLPSPSASKEEWQAYLDNSERVATAAKQYLQNRVTAGENPAAKITGGSSAPQPLTEAQVRAAGKVYSPDYEYAIVNGEVRQRKKGN